MTQRKQILQKFIRKVEVGAESVNIHYIVDQDYFEGESKLLAMPNEGDNPMLKNTEIMVRILWQMVLPTGVEPVF